MFLTKLLSFFISNNKTISKEDVEKEKEIIKNNIEIKKRMDLDKKRIETIKKAKNAFYYYSIRRCKNRISFFDRHKVYFEIKMCQNPYYKSIIREINIKCEFCDLQDGMFSTYFGDEYIGNGRWYFLSSLNITEKDLCY